jgi:thiol-disulfide isomerase/thioredoxin
MIFFKPYFSSMLSLYEPIVNATILFLRLLQVKVNNVTVNETLQSHPDWPSLLCISDALQKWNIPNAAARIQKEDIEQLPLPFIASTPKLAGRLAIVTKVTSEQIHYCSPGRQRSITAEKTDFFKKWDGVYLIAKPDPEAGEKNYKRVRLRLFLRSLPPFMFLLVLTGISFYGMQTIFKGHIVPGIYVHYVVFLSGIIISSLLLWYEIDRRNPLLQKICTGISKGSCETILTGPRAKLLGWISWSEVGFFYFSGSLLAMSFVPGAIHILVWLTLLALPYIVFSVFYQWRVAKRWCALCLAVQALLLINGIDSLAGSYIRPAILPAGVIWATACCILLPVLLWYSAKPYCLRLQQAVATKHEYLRIKFNTEIFDMLLKRQKALTSPAENLGIDLGSKGAAHTLVKVCNPYCGPCAIAHPKIEKLLEDHANLTVKIIFSTGSSDDDRRSDPVKHLMAIAEEKNEQRIKKALDDWYLAEKKDYHSFANRYPLNEELLAQQNNKLAAMNRWCRDMKVKATPTFFWNGYQLPDAYSIEDLQYFLLE